MSLTINTNIPAMTALLNLSNTNDQMSIAITRLSTGLRINTAADDPAGLIISEGMKEQINGIHQAVSNTQDAINMSKTADGAMSEVSSLLNSGYSLAVQSANTAVVDAATAEANQTQLQSIIDSINRIAEQTTFGTKKLLDGSSGLSANVTDTADLASIYIGGTFGGSGVVAGPVTVAETGQAARASVLLGQNFSSPNTVVATAGSFVVNGYSFTSDGTETLDSLVAKINDMSATTGVSAQIVGPVGGNYSVMLTANDYGSNYDFTYFDPVNILNNAGSANANNGANATCNVAVTTQMGVVTVAFTGGQGDQTSGLRLTDTNGNSLILTEGGNTNLPNAATTVGVLDGSTVRFQIGANANQSVQYSMPNIFANVLGTSAVPGKSLADIDVTTQSGASDAMQIIDAAITQVAKTRADLGSFQANFLESTAQSLSVAQENLTSSESQIQDTDFAQEMTDYTRLQVLRESGVAVLAQANKDPQDVLKLLQ